MSDAEKTEKAEKKADLVDKFPAAYFRENGETRLVNNQQEADDAVKEGWSDKPSVSAAAPADEKPSKAAKKPEAEADDEPKKPQHPGKK